MNEKLILVFKGFLGIFLYFAVSLCKEVPFILLGVDVNEVPPIITQTYSVLCEILIIICIALLFKKQIKASFEDLKVNHLKHFQKYFKVYVIALIVMMAGNAFVFSINGGDIAGNESSVRDLLVKYPIYTYISAVILAPILEELTFRLCLKNIFGPNTLFIIMSGLIFGSLHIIGSYTGPLDLLYLIPYGSFGVAFAYILVKTNNIFISMGFHFMHNGIIMAPQIMLLLFG